MKKLLELLQKQTMEVTLKLQNCQNMNFPSATKSTYGNSSSCQFSFQPREMPSPKPLITQLSLQGNFERHFL